jgi:hypothetical protein
VAVGEGKAGKAVSAVAVEMVAPGTSWNPRGRNAVAVDGTGLGLAVATVETVPEGTHAPRQAAVITIASVRTYAFSLLNFTPTARPRIRRRGRWPHFDWAGSPDVSRA